MNNISVNLIRRQIQEILEHELDRPIISTVIGPRQVGKTTLIDQLVVVLGKRGVDSRRVIRLNFDDMELRFRLSTHPGELRRELEIRLGVPLSSLENRIYLFLDEVQKSPELFDAIKLLFDRYRETIKIVITGSSTLQIRKRMAETLAGRIRYHYMYGLTLKEVISYYGFWGGEDGPLSFLLKGNLTEENVRMIQSEVWGNRRSIEVLQRRMLIFGSLPAVFQEESEDERWYMLRDYAATYIEKDIRLLGKVGDLDLFHRLYRTLLLQNGNLLNVSNLASDLGMSRNTINSYLGILEQTLVIDKIRAWATRPKARLMKAPKVYFFDSGLVNHAARRTNYRALQASGRLGAIAEGVFLFNILSFSRNMSIPPEVNFWRDYQGHELDFIIEGDNIYGVEFTTEDRLRKKRFDAIKYIQGKTDIRRFIIVGGFPSFEKLTVGSVTVYIIPSWLMF